MLDLKEKQKANLSLQRGYFRHQKKKKTQNTNIVFYKKNEINHLSSMRSKEKMKT